MYLSEPLHLHILVSNFSANSHMSEYVGLPFHLFKSELDLRSIYCTFALWSDVICVVLQSHLFVLVVHPV